MEHDGRKRIEMAIGLEIVSLPGYLNSRSALVYTSRQSHERQFWIVVFASSGEWGMECLLEKAYRFTEYVTVSIVCLKFHKSQRLL